MSILTESLPEYIVVRGQKCHIKTDFKVWLEFSSVFDDEGVTPEKIIKVFKLLFDKLPPNMFDAMNEIISFFAHSPAENKGNKDEKRTESKKYYDFEFDADLIFSAFYQQYKIDLTESNMHWWKFKALMNGLSDDTQFVKVVQFRSMDLSKIKDKEQKRFYSRMKALYRLPDNRSAEQKEESLNKAMEMMF